MVIMVVDDEELVRQVVVAALQHEGHSVLAVESGEEGLRVLRNSAGTVHLVLTDLRLNAGMEGLEFRERVLEEYPNVLVAVMSGDTCGGNIPAGVETVQKPFTAPQLCQRVRRLLTRRRRSYRGF
jgi:CheY-like chemotaxis protein